MMLRADVKKRGNIGSLFLVIVIIFIIILSVFLFSQKFHTSNAVTGKVSECVPSYSCGDWGACEEDFQKRVCKDTNCGEEIVERRLCSKECTPNVICNSWERCNYVKEFKDVTLKKMGFEGYQERKCIDVNGCIENYTEEIECVESYPVKFLVVTDCGNEYLTAVDTQFNKPVTKINLNSWKESHRLDINFVQSEEGYCSYCYDAITDFDEEGVDCGGSCMACKEEKIGSPTYLILGLWMVAGILIFSYTFTLPTVKVFRVKNLIYNGESYLLKGKIAKAKKIQGLIGKIYKDLAPRERALLEQDIKDYSFKISHYNRLSK